MRRLVPILIFAAVATLVVTEDAEARLFRRRARRSQSTSVARHVAPPVDAEGQPVSDQKRCEIEAMYMASHGIEGHVGTCIGRFEGCGWSSGRMPGTCEPDRRMRLTGDAIVRGARGMLYRVRSWR